MPGTVLHTGGTGGAVSRSETRRLIGCDFDGKSLRRLERVLSAATTTGCQSMKEAVAETRGCPASRYTGS